MNKHDIKCVDKCGTVLGSVDLDTVRPKGKYKGDAQYGFLCDDCVEKRNIVLKKKVAAGSVLMKKVSVATGLTRAEINTLLSSGRR